LSKNFSIKQGDEVSLVFFDKNSFSANPKVAMFSFNVIEIFESNGILDSNIAYVPFLFFNKFINKENIINKIEIQMRDPFKANNVILNAAKKINVPVFLYTWINDYQSINNDIKKVKAIIYLSLFLLITISCFSVTSISLMYISQKIRDIAILRSIGANNFLIRTIFLYYGLRSIIISAVIGLFLGVLTILSFQKIMFFFDKYLKNNILFENSYYKSLFLLQLHFSDIIIVFISTFFIGVITNWYPAYYASKLNPSDTLKQY